MTKFPEDNSQFWEGIYLEDDAGWDLGGATPIFDSMADSISPGKVCIIGCGRGYDAIMFAQKGFEVTAIDFAPSAIKAVKDLARKAKLAVNTIENDIFTLAPVYPTTFNLRKIT